MEEGICTASVIGSAGPGGQAEAASLGVQRDEQGGKGQWGYGE